MRRERAPQVRSVGIRPREQRGAFWSDAQETSPDPPQPCTLAVVIPFRRQNPVYESKSMQGLIDLVRKGFFPAGSKVLYAHVGGVPAINGYSYIYRNG